MPIGNREGSVWLIGAGPGDPGFITARGLELLGQADVVVYDALANPALLEHAPPVAERVYVGKRAGAHALEQDQIQQLLVDHARQGKRVVRLKGGDPYLFGRGAEEATFVAQHGIACQVVPGVTAGIAAPAAAGIPVTHRRIASTVTFVTGHEDPTKGPSSVDYPALAGLIQTGGTVCFYMGVGRLGAIVDQLLGLGVARDTPVGVVQWGTTPHQRQVRTRLRDAVADTTAANLGAPAIIIVGQVAGLQEPGLDGFTRRALFGKRVVITRTRQQASDLRRLLDDLGAITLEAPTIELVPPQDWTQVDQAIHTITQYDWLVLTSANGVTALHQRMDHLGFDARHLAGVKIAVIGDATQTALRHQLGIQADLVPPQFVAESLAQQLIEKHEVKNKNLLLLRADIARPALPKLLKAADANVTELTIYQTKLAPELPQEVLEALRENTVDWVTFTSSSTANNMVELLGPERALLEQVKIASIGPITSQTLHQLGLPPTIEAKTSNIPGLVEAIVAAQDTPVA